MLYAETPLILSESKTIVTEDTLKHNFEDDLLYTIGYTGQYNSSFEYHSLEIFRQKYDFKNLPFSVEANLVNFSFIDMGHKRHYSLNTWIAAMAPLGFTSNGSWTDMVILSPLIVGGIANMATNFEVQYAFDKKRIFSIFCGTSGDLYRIDKAERFRYTFTSGISLFRPVNLKVFYVKDINQFMDIEDREMIGVSLKYIGKADK